MSQRTDSQRNNPLSTAEARDLIENIYKHADQYWLNITDTDIVIAYDIANDRFYKATHENVWNATDPIQYLIDDLTSTDGTSSALSANQGRVLKELLDALNEDLDDFKKDTATKFETVNIELVRLDTFINDVNTDLNDKITDLRLDMEIANEYINERIDNVVIAHDEDVAAIKAVTDNLNDIKLNNLPTDLDRVRYFDELPVESSTRYINSGGVASAIKTAITAMYIAKGNATVVNGIVKKGDVDATRIVGYTYNLIDIEPDTQVDVFINGVDASAGVMKCSLWDDLCWTDDGWNLMSKHINLDDYAMKDWTDNRISTLEIDVNTTAKTIPSAINELADNSKEYTDTAIANLKQHIEDNFHQYYTVNLTDGTTIVSDSVLNDVNKRGTYIYKSSNTIIGILVVDGVNANTLYGTMSDDNTTYILRDTNSNRDTETNSIRNSRRKVVTNYWNDVILANGLVTVLNDDISTIPHMSLKGVHAFNNMYIDPTTGYTTQHSISIGIVDNTDSMAGMKIAVNGVTSFNHDVNGKIVISNANSEYSITGNQMRMYMAIRQSNRDVEPEFRLHYSNSSTTNWYLIMTAKLIQMINDSRVNGVTTILNSYIRATDIETPVGNIKTIKSDNITNTAKIITDTLEAKTIKSTTTTASSNFFKQ